MAGGAGFVTNTQGNKERTERGRKICLAKKKAGELAFGRKKKEKFCNYLLERGQKKTAQPGGWI